MKRKVCIKDVTINRVDGTGDPTCRIQKTTNGYKCTFPTGVSLFEISQELYYIFTSNDATIKSMQIEQIQLMDVFGSNWIYVDKPKHITVHAILEAITSKIT